MLIHSGVITTVTKLNFSTLPLAKVRFIEPMYARLVNELPEGNEWFYEVKFDGYRSDTLVQARKPLHKSVPKYRQCLRTSRRLVNSGID